MMLKEHAIDSGWEQQVRRGMGTEVQGKGNGIEKITYYKYRGGTLPQAGQIEL